MDSATTKYLGKYRGTVVVNVDPMRKGRIQVQVPDVHGMTPSTWAMPCVPVAGLLSGFFTVPPVGAGVWVEFEQGDPDYPIWVGGYWGSMAEVPLLSNTVPPPAFGITLQSPLGNGIVISDTMGVVIKCGPTVSVIINQTGILFQAGTSSIAMTATGQVAINQTALVVT